MKNAVINIFDTVAVCSNAIWKNHNWAFEILFMLFSRRPTNRLEMARKEFRKILNSLGNNCNPQFHEDVERASKLHDLWLLRKELCRLVNKYKDTRYANTAVRRINRHFPNLVK